MLTPITLVAGKSWIIHIQKNDTESPVQSLLRQIWEASISGLGLNDLWTTQNEDTYLRFIPLCYLGATCM